MEYRDPTYSARTLFSDFRVHAENWRRFRKATGTWPVISIVAYVGRFFLIVAGVILAIWYGALHDLTKGRSFLLFLAVLVPVILVWFVVENVAWNYELRHKGISSSSDIWKVSQFPES
jgi:hypothetical protein